MDNNKLIKMAIGVTLVLIAVLTAVYFLLPALTVTPPTQKPSSAAPSAQKASIPRDPAVSTQVTQDLSKWKEYTSPIFSFKYPPEWKSEVVRSGNVVLYSPDLLEPPKGTPISVYINESKSFAAIVYDVSQVLENVKETPIQTGNLSGKEIAGELNEPTQGKVKMYITLLDHGGKAVVTEYTVYEGAADYQEVYQNIVKSITL